MAQTSPAQFLRWLDRCPISSRSDYPTHRVGDEALRDLHGMPRLRQLTLSDEIVTPSGLLALVESLPNLGDLWVGVTPFRSKGAIEQLKDRLRQAPAGSATSSWEEVDSPRDPGSALVWHLESDPTSRARRERRYSLDRERVIRSRVGSQLRSVRCRLGKRTLLARPGWSPPDEGPCVLERTKGLAIGPDDTVWVVHDKELWQYNSGGWRRVIEPTQTVIGDVAASADGSAHAYRMSGTLYSIRDSVTTATQTELVRSMANCIAADAAGTVWIGTSAGVSRLKDGTWRTWKGSADGLPVVRDPGMDEFGWETRDWTPITSITIDPTGVTWIAGRGGIARFTEDRWELHASRKEHPYFFHSIATDDAGQIYATGGRNVATYLDGDWRVAEAPDHLLAGEAQASSDRCPVRRNLGRLRRCATEVPTHVVGLNHLGQPD